MCLSTTTSQLPRAWQGLCPPFPSDSDCSAAEGTQPVTHSMIYWLFHGEWIHSCTLVTENRTLRALNFPLSSQD